VPVSVHNVLRLACAALCVAALAYQAGSLAEQGVFRPENFFSFFTVQSNLLAAATFSSPPSGRASARSGSTCCGAPPRSTWRSRASSSRCS
jgi:uncharacterized membrane protein YbhN (UPF0104 family)